MSRVGKQLLKRDGPCGRRVLVGRFMSLDWHVMYDIDVYLSSSVIDVSLQQHYLVLGSYCSKIAPSLLYRTTRARKSEKINAGRV